MQAGKTEGFSNYVTFETTGQQLRESSRTQNPKPEEENEEGEEEAKRSKCSCSWRSGYSC
jgi:hypothetical protein